MRFDALDIPALAAEFTATHPELTPQRQRLALMSYRLLGKGQPFAIEELARRGDLPAAEVASFFDEWPIVQRDDQGRVVAATAERQRGSGTEASLS